MGLRPSLMEAARGIFADEGKENMEIPAYRTETEDLIFRLRNHKDAGNRYHAAEALAVMGPRAVSAVPALLASLEKDGSIFVRKSAAIALGEIGNAATEVQVGLRRAASQDENAYVRERAQQSLKRICHCKL